MCVDYFYIRYQLLLYINYCYLATIVIYQQLSSINNCHLSTIVIYQQLLSINNCYLSTIVIYQHVLSINNCYLSTIGGTTVSGAVECPATEHRMIVSLDTSKMNRIIWIDHANMMARVECGVVGVELDKKVRRHNKGFNDVIIKGLMMS